MLKLGCQLFLKRLWKDEDGVVLMLTMVVFMTLYVMGAAVFAVGENIRQRIEVQNAADAAAYSAAVIQADTISRIATINRAMSWTYRQQITKQMDIILDRWLEKTLDTYGDDSNRAESKWSPVPSRCSCCEPSPKWGIGFSYLGHFTGLANSWAADNIPGETLEINGMSWPVFKLELEAARLLYLANLASQGIFTRFHAELLVQNDHYNIWAMNRAEEDLILQLPKRIDDAIERSLQDNLVDNASAVFGTPDFVYASDHARWTGFPSISLPPFPGRLANEQPNTALQAVSYFQMLDNEHDMDFIQYSIGQKIPGADHKAQQQWIEDNHFGDGSGPDVDEDDWFSFDRDGASYGMQRRYNRDLKDNAILRARWWWYGWNWFGFCFSTPFGCAGTCAIPDPSSYGFPFLQEVTEVFADDDDIYEDDLYNTAHALPWKLKPEFFGNDGMPGTPNGTISVGVARKMRNPMMALGANVSTGLYGIFEPGNRYTWAVAASHAGYLDDGRPGGDGTYNPTKDSHFIVVDGDDPEASWKKEGWTKRVMNGNLMQTDWDAVLIPISAAWSDREAAWAGGSKTRGGNVTAGKWKTISEMTLLNHFWRRADWTAVAGGSGGRLNSMSDGSPPRFMGSSSEINYNPSFSAPFDKKNAWKAWH